MERFFGEYQHTIDEKGRLAIPKRFRLQLVQGAVVTKGLDGSLFLYTKEAWDELAEKVAKLPLTSEAARAFQRHLLGGAMEAQIDKQGRINIPAYLREHAGIKSAVVVAGLYNRIELWAADKFNAYEKEKGGQTDEIAEQLGGII